MKSKKRVISILLFISFSILITILLASPAHSTKTEPIPITKIVYNPPDPVIDDGEPGLEPDMRWYGSNDNVLYKNEINPQTYNKSDSNTHNEFKMILRSILIKHLLSIITL